MITTFAKKAYFCMACLIIGTTTASALPFTITPKAGTTLPVSLSNGQQTRATYTVQNNTATTRYGNFIKYLPPNVTQITTNPNYPDLCGATFTLQAKNSVGDSCTLELLISGPVNAKDSSPNHHLFACFPGGKTCVGTNYPLNVTSAQLQNIVAVAGGYINPNTSAGIMALSKSADQGTTWQAINLPLPAQYQSASLGDIICNQGLCVGVGAYINNSGVNFPAVITSPDNGNSWSQQTLNLPSGYTDGRLASVFCRGTLCQAVGFSQDGSNVTQPLVARSNDSGMTWTTQALTFPGQTVSSGLFGVTCQDSICFAVGYYQDFTQANGIIMQSTDNGQTWQTNYQAGVGILLNSLSCNSRSCIAVGINDVTHTAIYYTSNNLGQSWTANTIAGSSLLDYTQLLGIHCTETYCVGVGQTSNQASFNNNEPLTTQFTASGVASSSSVINSPPNNDCGLNAVYCSESSCVAAGSCSSSPYLAVNQDNGLGQTWSQSLVAIPDDMTAGSFNGVG